MIWQKMQLGSVMLWGEEGASGVWVVALVCMSWSQEKGTGEGQHSTAVVLLLVLRLLLLAAAAAAVGGAAVGVFLELS